MAISKDRAKLFSKIIYSILGALLVVAGLAALFNPSVLMPGLDASNVDHSEHIVHLQEAFKHVVQEFGVVLFGLGGVIGWASFNYDKAKGLNYVLLLFFLIFAGIHWVEYFSGNRGLESPLMNSIPALLISILVGIRTNSTKE